MVATDQIINDFKQACSIPALLQMLLTTCAHATSPSQSSSQTMPNRSLLDELRRTAPSSTASVSTSSPSRPSTSTHQTIESNEHLKSLKRALYQPSSQESSTSSSSEDTTSDEVKQKPLKCKSAALPAENIKQDKLTGKTDGGKKKKTGKNKQTIFSYSLILLLSLSVLVRLYIIWDLVCK